MDETLMEMAVVMSARGTCSRGQVGCAVAREDRVLATGYNGAPHGVAHCVHPADEPRLASCRVAVHAEANAVAFAARHGIALNGATVYTTLSPCVTCAQLLVNAGVRGVFSRARYRDVTGIELLARANVLAFTRCLVDPGRPRGEARWVRDYGQAELVVPTSPR